MWTSYCPRRPLRITEKMSPRMATRHAESVRHVGASRSEEIPGILGGVVFLFVCGLLWGGCSRTEPSATDDQPATEPVAAVEEAPMPKNLNELLPEGLGKPLVLETCGSCHAIACSAIGQRTEGRWKNLKEDHRDKVASLSEQELETVFGYLNEHFSAGQPEPRVPPHFLEGGCTPF